MYNKNEVLPFSIPSVSLNHLQPGDILLYKPSTPEDLAIRKKQHAITFFQSIQTEGRYYNDSVHAAICVQIVKGKPLIAHMIEDGYVICQIGDSNYPSYATNRPFNIYRPNNPVAAKFLAHTASMLQEENVRHPYAWGNLIKTWGNKQIDPAKKIKKNKQELPTAMVCSEFCVRAMKKAWTDSNNEKIEGFPYPNIRSIVSPKTLEDYLAQNPGFTKMIYLGNNSFRNFANLVVHVLENSNLYSNMEEFSPIQRRIMKTIFRLFYKELNDLDKILILKNKIFTPENQRIFTQHGIETIQNYLNTIKNYHISAANVDDSAFKTEIKF